MQRLQIDRLDNQLSSLVARTLEAKLAIVSIASVAKYTSWRPSLSVSFPSFLQGRLVPTISRDSAVDAVGFNQFLVAHLTPLIDFAGTAEALGHPSTRQLLDSVMEFNAAASALATAYAKDPITETMQESKELVSHLASELVSHLASMLVDEHVRPALKYRAATIQTLMRGVLHLRTQRREKILALRQSYEDLGSKLDEQLGAYRKELIARKIELYSLSRRHARRSHLERVSS